jgi:hypothetical protein
MSKSLVLRLFYAEKRKSRLVSGFSPLFDEKVAAFVITFKKRNGNEGISEGLNEGLIINP